MGFWFAMTSMPSPDARMEIIAANAAKIPPRVVEAALKDCTSSQLAALTERLSSGFERRCAGDDDCPALSSFRSIRGRIHRAKRDGRHAPTIEPLGALAAIGHVVRAHRGEVIPNRMMTLTVDAAWSSYGRADTMEWLFGFCRTSFANNTRAVRRATRRCMDVGPTPEFIVAHLLEFSPSALAEWLGSVTPQTSRMFWAAVLRRMESDRSDPPFAVRLARHVEWILRQQGKRELGSRIEIMALYAFVLDVLSQQDPTPLRTSPWVGALVGARGNLDPDPSAVAGRAVTEDWIYTTGCEVADRCERGPEFRRRWRGASKPPQPPQPEPAQPVPAG
jgi:hypothetical protein